MCRIKILGLRCYFSSLLRRTRGPCLSARVARGGSRRSEMRLHALCKGRQDKRSATATRAGDGLGRDVAPGLAAASPYLSASRPGAADDPPIDSGKPGRRYVIRGGSVTSLEPPVG